MDIFEKAAETMDKATETGRNLFKAFLNWILLAAIIITTTILTFVALGIEDRLTKEVLVNAGVMALLGSITMFVFFPQGESNESEQNKPYRENLRRWGDCSDSVRKQGKIKAFAEHCKVKTDEQLKNIKEALIMNAGIELAEYERAYKDKTIKEISADKQLARKQKHLLIKAKKDIRISPYNHYDILAGAKYEYSTGGMSIKTKLLLQRIGYTFGVALVLGLITFSAKAVDWAAIALFAMRLLTIITSAIVGFYGGIKKIKADNDSNKTKILFINEFLESFKE